MKKSNFEIRLVKISDLKPAEYNPREITKEALDGLKASIKKFGLVENVVANKDMTLISGHQRLKALTELGFQDVNCVILDLNKEDEKKLNIALNNPHIQGSFTDQLQILLEELKVDFEDFTALNLQALEVSDITEFEPEGFDEKDRLDKLKLHKCPECGYEFKD